MSSLPRSESLDAALDAYSVTRPIVCCALSESFPSVELACSASFSAVLAVGEEPCMPVFCIIVLLWWGCVSALARRDVARHASPVGVDLTAFDIVVRLRYLAARRRHFL